VDELVGNALRFSVPGQRVTVTGSAHATGYRIKILDQGPGMTPEQCAGIGPFVQFGREKREQQGLGLGLAIARSVAEIGGGGLSLQAGPGGRGLLATLDLPVA
jgi:signal transduction histidine kinase